MPIDKVLVWFRRDLRCSDHAALAHALRDARSVECAFVFDRNILDPLLAEGRQRDRRVEFIHRSLAALDARLRRAGGALRVLHGDPVQIIPQLARELGVDAVYLNRDTEPYALERDARVERALAADRRGLRSFKDQVVFERDEVMTGSGRPFSVFTPYRTAWLRRLAEAGPAALQEHDVRLQDGRLAPPPPAMQLPPLEAFGFRTAGLDDIGIEPGESGAARALADFEPRLARYAEARDFPSVRGPSYLSVHLRFGTVSVRALARLAQGQLQAAREGEDASGARTWLSELIWREFYQMVLYHHPRIVDRAFDPRFDRIAWRDDPGRLQRWCEGRTGYPLVDAAMTQLSRTGYMHNRLRMVAASFLVKDLGIDWRLGERWFGRQLNDYDLASNVGGWQWAASTGCDAQPWFRIFNPVTQSRKFDGEGRFIRRYLPQLGGFVDKEIHEPWNCDPARQRQAGCIVGADYPAPVVDHAKAREETLQRYAVVRQQAEVVND
jgi:deoxyribodipyrimidine photo-lyase